MSSRGVCRIGAEIDSKTVCTQIVVKFHESVSRAGTAVKGCVCFVNGPYLTLEESSLSPPPCEGASPQVGHTGGSLDLYRGTLVTVRLCHIPRC